MITTNRRPCETRKFGKICLIMPRSERVSLLRTDYSPPLGLMSIGAYIKNSIADVDIKLINGELSDESDVLSEIYKYEPDVVGITTNVGCYRSGLHLAKLIKKNLPNVLMVLGGPYVSSLWEECLSERNYIDCCVVGDGEVPMTSIVQGQLLSSIPGVATRNQYGTPILLDPIDVPLDMYPDPDWSLINADSYQDSYRKAYNKPGATFASICSRKGCSWRVKCGGCIFCGLERASVRTRSPERVWREVSLLRSSMNCDHFWELSDTICSDVSWLRRFAELRSSCTDSLTFHGYARSSEITPDVGSILQQIGFREIFIGAESGDNAVLKAANKGTTANTNIRATSILSKNNIGTFASVVLGMPGETRESLQKTYDHVLRLFSEGLSTLSVCVFTPYPGSRAYTVMLEDTGEKKKDVYDWPQFAKNWIERKCECSFNDVMHTLNRLQSLEGCFYEDNFAYVNREYDIS